MSYLLRESGQVKPLPMTGTFDSLPWAIGREIECLHSPSRTVRRLLNMVYEQGSERFYIAPRGGVRKRSNSVDVSRPALERPSIFRIKR